MLPNPYTRFVLPSFSLQNANALLLVFVCITVFLIPVMPLEKHRLLYKIFYSAIFFTSVAALKSNRKSISIAALVAFIANWIAQIFDAELLVFLSSLATIVFFIAVVILLIIQIARYKNVTFTVIAEAVTAYLLLGLMFNTLVLIVLVADPGAFNFEIEGKISITDINYFTFVTFATLGYGDLLPLTPVGKSLSLFIAISGQMYLAIIVATLVGKFLNRGTP